MLVKTHLALNDSSGVVPVMMLVPQTMITPQQVGEKSHEFAGDEIQHNANMTSPLKRKHVKRKSNRVAFPPLFRGYVTLKLRSFTPFFGMVTCSFSPNAWIPSGGFFSTVLFENVTKPVE